MKIKRIDFVLMGPLSEKSVNLQTKLSSTEKLGCE